MASMGPQADGTVQGPGQGRGASVETRLSLSVSPSPSDHGHLLCLGCQASVSPQQKLFVSVTRVLTSRTHGT